MSKTPLWPVIYVGNQKKKRTSGIWKLTDWWRKVACSVIQICVHVLDCIEQWTSFFLKMMFSLPFCCPFLKTPLYVSETWLTKELLVSFSECLIAVIWLVSKYKPSIQASIYTTGGHYREDFTFSCVFYLLFFHANVSHVFFPHFVQTKTHWTCLLTLFFQIKDMQSFITKNPNNNNKKKQAYWLLFCFLYIIIR